ncbi:MAG TPA: hypothetical protein VF042_13695 [Gemmatimonadaceae bacterium]
MIEERHIAVTRTARYYVLGTPGPDIDDVWFACHGYGQLAADFAREFEIIAERRRLLVVPEALSRYYVSTAPEVHGPESRVAATWMTREDRETEISDYVGYLDDLYAEVMGDIGHSKVSVTVLGFSQGGATANRWVTRGTSRVDRLLMWGSLLASDSDLNDAAAFFREVELVLVHGTRDQYADSGMIEKYREVLAAHSIPYRYVTFEGGHRMDRDTLKGLANVMQAES